MIEHSAATIYLHPTVIMMFSGKYVDPPNPFASKVHWKQPADDTKESVEAKAVPTVSEPQMTNAKTMRAPIVEQKKRYQKRRLPGERLLRRVARIAPPGAVPDEAEYDGDLDNETMANLHGAIGDIIERMKI